MRHYLREILTLNSFTLEDKDPRCTRLKPILALRLLSKGLYKGYGTCQPKSQKLLLVLLENAGKVLKGRKGFRNAGKFLKM